MSSGIDELLDAAIGQLDEMKRRGSRFVSLTTESLAVLAKAVPASGGATATAPRRAAAASVPVPRPAPAAAPAAESAIREKEARTPVGTIPTGAIPTAGAAPIPPPAPTPPGIAPVAPAALVAPVVPAGAPSSPLTTADKLEAMRELRERALVCLKCADLAAARTNVVFGVGSVDARLMFVGEAPGADEDRQGEPFVGAAGQLLTKIIQTMGLSRETVYIANILKCRPDTPGQASGNRKPTAEEMKTCLPYLQSQIDIIQPSVLVALGATAVEGLLGPIGGITKLRGHWKEYRGIPLMPTFHPAYLLRNMALSEKRKVWEDMLQVMEKLGMPIDDRQRRFFLPKGS